MYEADSSHIAKRQTYVWAWATVKVDVRPKCVFQFLTMTFSVFREGNAASHWVYLVDRI